jgi:hypothetical protein
MPKPSQGRFDGVYGMTTFTAGELLAWSADYERLLRSPYRTDDPKWLQRRADRLRRVAVGKEAAREHKLSQKRDPRAG